MPPKHPLARILVVDDEEQIRDLLCRHLLEEGYAVAEAADGLAALEILRSEGADLVILDLVMPECEGTEAVVQLRREFPDLPILAISGVVGADFYLQAAKMLGAHETLRKPFEKDELIAKVGKMLQV